MDDILQNISIQQAVLKLPKKSRIVIAMRSAGFTQQQTGTLLGVTRTDIWTTEKEAHKRLRQEIIDAT